MLLFEIISQIKNFHMVIKMSNDSGSGSISGFSNGDLDTLPEEYARSLLQLYQLIQLFNKNGEDWKIATVKDSRWNVLLLFQCDDNKGKKEIISHIWHKCKVRPATKNQRNTVIKILGELSLTERLTQETIGKMLSVSTGTINKDLKN